MKKTVAVLFGGISSEYEVSLHSAAAVLRAVNPARYEVLPVGITRTGQWLLCKNHPDAVEADSWWQDEACVPVVLSPSREDHGLLLFHPDGIQTRTLDIVFPVLHGKNGEDGSVQGLLQLAGIPCVGCGTLASALCMDKDIAHRLALQAGIPCPAFAVVHRASGTPGHLAKEVQEQMKGVPLPWFVKPATEGSSFGVTRVQNTGALEAALTAAFGYAEKVVVEEGIDGFEVGCAVLGNQDLTVGSVDAISLEKGFFDYHEKYNLETAQILLPAPISEKVAQAVQQQALALYRLFGCHGFARVDLFLASDGRIVFNEINTIPGLTAHSRFPGMLAHKGLPFEAMIQRLLDLAEEEVFCENTNIA